MRRALVAFAIAAGIGCGGSSTVVRGDSGADVATSLPDGAAGGSGGGGQDSGSGGLSGAGGAGGNPIDAGGDGQVSPTDAGRSCPAQVPRGPAPNYTPAKCTTLDYQLRCTYHSGPTSADGPSTCDQTFACQCTGGGPSTDCNWMNTTIQTCP